MREFTSFKALCLLEAKDDIFRIIMTDSENQIEEIYHSYYAAIYSIDDLIAYIKRLKGCKNIAEVESVIFDECY